jgi:hypothetical protein
MVSPGGWAKRLAEHLGQGLCGAVIVMEGARVLEVWGPSIYASLASALEQTPRSSRGIRGELQAERALIRPFAEGVEQFCPRPWAR